MARGTYGFRPVFNLVGGRIVTRAYDPAASEAFDPGDCLSLQGDDTVAEAADATTDMIGASLVTVTSGSVASGELAPYTGTEKTIPVAIFDYTNVFEVDDENDQGTAAVADIGTIADVEVVSNVWGINTGTSGTANTPNFRVIDIEPTRGLYLVVAAPLELADVFQFFDAAA